MTSKPLAIEEVIIEELAKTNQLPRNMNNLIEPSTILTDKVELFEDSDLLIYPSVGCVFCIGVSKLLDNRYS